MRTKAGYFYIAVINLNVMSMLSFIESAVTSNVIAVHTIQRGYSYGGLIAGWYGLGYIACISQITNYSFLPITLYLNDNRSHSAYDMMCRLNCI